MSRSLDKQIVRDLIYLDQNDNGDPIIMISPDYGKVAGALSFAIITMMDASIAPTEDVHKMLNGIHLLLDGFVDHIHELGDA